MRYNVIVSDDKDFSAQFRNELVFHFGENKEKAVQFVELILKISDYYVSILPIKEENDE